MQTSFTSPQLADPDSYFQFPRRRAEAAPKPVVA